MGEYGMGKDHMLVYYEHDGEDIASYIKKKLSDDRYNCRVTLVDISDNEMSPPRDAKLSVLLLTPEMEQCMRCPENTERFGNLPVSPRSAVVLLHSVDNNSDVNDVLASRLKGFKKWTLLELGTTADDFKESLIRIMQLVDKPPSLKQFSVIPKAVQSSSDEICVIFKKDMHGEVTVWVNEDGIEIKTRKLNPCTYSFKLRGVSHGTKQIEIFEDNDFLGTTSLKLLSKMDTIEYMLYDVNNPQELLCQVLRVDNIVDLDLEMCDILSSSKEETDTLPGVDDISKLFTVQESKNELPTLLHFGAKFGLRGFCEKLLECPGSQLALNIRNRYNLTPSQLAKLKGFDNLSTYLHKSYIAKETNDDYIEMSSQLTPYTGYQCMGLSEKTLFRQPGRNTFGASEDMIHITEDVFRRQTTAGQTQYQIRRGGGDFSNKGNELLLPSDSVSSSFSSDSNDSGVSAVESTPFTYRNGNRRHMTERLTLMWNDFNWTPPPPPRDTPQCSRL